jgi:hypothetical protein
MQLERFAAKTAGSEPRDSTIRTGVPVVAQSNSFIAEKIGRLTQPCEQCPFAMSPA